MCCCGGEGDSHQQVLYHQKQEAVRIRGEDVEAGLRGGAHVRKQTVEAVLRYDVQIQPAFDREEEGKDVDGGEEGDGECQ